MPRIDPGRRALIAGKTGTGKSVLACWMLYHSPGAWIILNPKHTAAYKNLPDSTVVNGLDFSRIERGFKRHRFVVVNPSSRESDPDNLDDFVMQLHENWQNVGLCCDELYSMHKNAVAGAGLIGWLTRGRELKQSFLGLTQRPAFLSKFLFSESDYIVGMQLQLRDDRRRMVEMTDKPQFAAKIPRRHWLWFDVAADSLTHYGAVPIDY